tara:strand:- start:1132 stop:1860 length:729 start_codon:yes stop_codon:yes gene_type:complete
MVHLGIIPDGNRRWCKKNDYNLNTLTKHWTHLILSHINKCLSDNTDNFKYLKQINEISLYVCSIDNINRNDNTPSLIFNLIRKIYDIIKQPNNYLEPTGANVFISNKEKYKNNINLIVNFIGDVNVLPKDIQDIIQELQNELKTNYQNPDAKKFTLNIAIAYDYNKDMTNYGSYHMENYNREQSNIDVVFRSGGEKRISGFFPTKILYSELFFDKTLWPDITLFDLNKIIKKFFHRNRRFGK